MPEKDGKAAAGPKKSVTSKKSAAKATKLGPVIYIGPTVKGTLLRTFKIFADGIPAEYKGEPIIAGLFVTPEKLESARRSVGQKGSKLNVFYKQADKVIAGKKGGN